MRNCRFMVLLCGTYVMTGLAQRPVDPRNLHERLLCKVPMQGSGSDSDPRRPLFVPAPSTAKTNEVPAINAGAIPILGFTYVVSDDGKDALVEFVGRTKQDLSGIVNSGRADVKVFEKGKDSKDAIEAEFRKYKKDFDLARFLNAGPLPVAAPAAGGAR